MTTRRTGTDRHVVTVQHGLGPDNGPAYEGELLVTGPVPFAERIKRRYDRTCTDCGETAFHGEYRVAVTDRRLLGVRLHRRTDAVTFTCLSCLHEIYPTEYPDHDGL